MTVSGRRRRVPAVLAGTLAATAVSVSTAVALPSDPELDEGRTCLALTTLESFQVGDGDLGDGAELDWSVSAPCSGVTVKLAGDPVAHSGSRRVDPDVTTRYRITAGIFGYTRTLGSRIVVAGKVVGYYYSWWGDQYYASENYGTGADEANVLAGRMMDALSEPARRGLLGKSVEVHLIPVKAKLTDLPPWRHLAGKRTGGANDRAYDDLRGVGGQLIPGTDRIAMAVGAESLFAPGGYYSEEAGHTLVHEMGHTVLDNAVPWLKDSVAELLADRGPNADYLGDDSYTMSNADEYWAEGTAAMFGYYFPDASHFGEFTENWLKSNDHPLWKQLDAVYRRR